MRTRTNATRSGSASDHTAQLAQRGRERATMDWQLSNYITQLNDDPNFTLSHNPVDVAQLDQHELHNALNSTLGLVGLDEGLAGLTILRWQTSSTPSRPSQPQSQTPTPSTNSRPSSSPHADALSGQALSKLLDAITSSFSSLLDSLRAVDSPTDHSSYRSFKDPLEIYAFFVMWCVRVGEKVGAKAGEGETGRGKKSAASKSKSKSKSSAKDASFSWPSQIPDILGVMVKALRTIKTERIWVTTAERDEVVASCFLRPLNVLCEHESYLKQPEIKAGIFRILCLAAKNHGQAFNVQMTIMQSLQYTEHLAEPMAELVTVYAKEFDSEGLGEKVLGEIADRQFSAQDTKGPRSFSRFLIRLAETSPRTVLKQIVLLQKHLDSESYPMRNAILEVLGLLIRELALTEPGALSLDPAKHTRLLSSFFDLLTERLMDLNSYVRAKTASVLLKTCDLPPSRFPAQRLEIARLAARSLYDKASTVRKNCLALLVKLVVTHPYGLHGGELGREMWEERLAKLESELKVLDLPDEAEREARKLMEDVPEEGEEGEGENAVKEEEEEQEEDDDDESDAEGTPKKRKPLKGKGKARASAPRRSELDLAAADQSAVLSQVDSATLQRLRLTKAYYSDALSFIETLEGALDTVTELLASSVKGEVLEAIEFCKTCKEYKVEAAEQGVRRMLHLIWSKDEAGTAGAAATGAANQGGGEGDEDAVKEAKGIRSRLIECYSQLYFEPPQDVSEKDQVAFVARNVIELTRDATLAELTSLEQLLAVMMAKGVVDDQVITKLWQVYSTSKDIPKFQRRGAIIVLGMFAQTKPEVVADHVDTLLKIGLGPHGKQDLVLAKYTCIALGRVGGSVKKVKGSLNDAQVRLPMDSPVFARLAEAIQTPSSLKEWFSMAEQAVNTIYNLGDQPDALCSEVLRQMTVRVFGPRASPKNKGKAKEQDGEDVDGDAEMAEDEAKEAGEDAAPDAMDEDDGAAGPQDPLTGNAFDLSQLVFVAGHCAIKQLVHLELVERDLKRRKAEEDKAKGDKKAADDELDQVAGSVEDEIGDVIAAAKEKELLYGPESLLAVFGPMAATIVAQPKIYKNSMLQTAATLALSKFMCVSSEFCAAHLMLLFKVLETSKEPAVRSNIVIALGDIAVCFSTIMDENSDRLYAGLHDKDPTVKKNTLMVLTHLILNGMIKVKGQLGEMAKCLSDDDKRIKDLAHLFFEELATKDKAIYNNLPDIISHLSTGANPVSEDTFQTSMRFIFKFKKEAESVVEKLCQRFQATTEPRQWRDIAFCLSLLPFNSDLAVKKLTEGLPFYQDKLHEETVFKRFGEILAKIRAPTNKLNKTESDLKEFEDALEAHRAKGAEDQDLTKKVAKSRRRGAAAPKAAAAAPARRAARRAKARSETPPSSPER
ncbi:Condensin complex subunit 1 [Rhodotorula toruloides ATCC 204091]|uniref:Condensin complex subunit 1 n=1 Tax=Rhodotorula toruloides TaxID=5286 RepID=A0A0K3CST1_RHOTO|nr:Condensin complex subunit 1 [Rhodotorula toruloides ATCC 204091]